MSIVFDKFKASERTKLYAPVPPEVLAIDVYCYGCKGELIEAKLGMKRTEMSRLWLAHLTE